MFFFFLQYFPIKFIDATKDVPLKKFLDSYYGRATSKKFQFRRKLDFIQKWSDQIESVKMEFKIPVFAFMGDDKRDNVLAKVPKEMSIDGFQTRKFLKQAIYSLNADQVTIDNLNAKICAEIDFKLNKNDAIAIIESFNKWEKRPSDAELFQKIQPFIGAMEAQHKILRTTLDKQLKDVIDLKKKLYTNWYAIHLKLNQLLKTSDHQMADFIIEENEQLFGMTFTMNGQFIISLGNLLNELKKFNNQRIAWVEFLIGMRKTHKID